MNAGSRLRKGFKIIFLAFASSLYFMKGNVTFFAVIQLFQTVSQQISCIIDRPNA